MRFGWTEAGFLALVLGALAMRLWELDGRTGSSTYRRLKTKYRDADIDPMSGMPVPRSGGRPYDHDEEIDPMSGMPVYRKRERNPFK